MIPEPTRNSSVPAPPPLRQWQLRPMQDAHLPAVMAVERRAYPFPWTEGIFRDCLRAGYSAWVLTDAAAPAAEIFGYALMTMAVDEAHILNLCVDPEQQRQGLGEFMLQHLLRLARAANATIALLEVRKSNDAAQRLYERLGFERLGLRKGYYPAAEGRREDALVLGLQLL